MTDEQTKNLLDNVISKCEDLQQQGNPKAEDFAFGIQETVESMAKFFENTGYLTDKQIKSIHNMNYGIDRWISTMNMR